MPNLTRLAQDVEEARRIVEGHHLRPVLHVAFCGDLDTLLTKARAHERARVLTRVREGVEGESVGGCVVLADALAAIDRLAGEP